MDGSWGHYAKQNMSDGKTNTVYLFMHSYMYIVAFIYSIFLKKSNFTETELNSACQKLGREGNGIYRSKGIFVMWRINLEGVMHKLVSIINNMVLCS